MTMNALQLVFKNRGMEPTRIAHRNNGTTTLTWHVDDNDNRFVLVSDSPRSQDFLLLCRNEKAVEAIVLDDVDEIVRWVTRSLRKLGATKVSG